MTSEREEHHRRCRTSSPDEQEWLFRALAINPDLGVNEGDSYNWVGGWGENTFLEIDEPALIERAGNWCTERRIDANVRDALSTWLSGLPWRDGYLMLHLAV